MSNTEAAGYANPMRCSEPRPVPHVAVLRVGDLG